MKKLIRLIRIVLPGHRAALIIAIFCSLAISATPYGFSFLGKWLVDDVLAIGALSAMGESLNTMFSTVSGELDTAVGD